MNPTVESLLRILEVLEEDAERQLAYLARLFPGVEERQLSVDELGLEFDDVAQAACVALSVAGVARECIASIERLDVALSDMSGTSNADLWTPSGLRHASEWDKVRRLAREALQAINTGLPSRDTTDAKGE